MAHGMLLNVMLSMRAPEHVDDDAALGDLATCAFGLEGLCAVTEPRQ